MYAEFNPAVIHGDIDAKNRQVQVHKFQKDDTCRVFIGCTPACREGLTLTAASNVVFVDMEWNWANYSQAWSRAHRYGQKNAVTVHNLICKGTIDEHVHNVVKTKKFMAETILDVRMDTSTAMMARDFITELIGEDED
jgi:SNF2 family DNA or RNA helicase